MTTSREPIGVAGEVSWRVPSLSLADEAIELFIDRARHARPDFAVTDDNAAAVAEICRRLDGLPLAIELAAARVRALSLAEILDSLHDRFRLLTGGARTAVRRQQTLRASVDWSHALLTEPERMLVSPAGGVSGRLRPRRRPRRIAGGGEVERYQVLDLLTLLVDKSLVVADESRGRTRYRLLETVRQYALEKLGESGEADAVRDASPRSLHGDGGRCSTRRQAVTMSSVSSRPKPRSTTCAPRSRGAAKTVTLTLALALASSLQPLWQRAAAPRGVAWFDAVLPTRQRAPPRDGVRRCARGRWPTGSCWPPMSGGTRTSGSGRRGPGDRPRASITRPC